MSGEPVSVRACTTAAFQFSAQNLSLTLNSD